jgi:hypothetical protein
MEKRVSPVMSIKLTEKEKESPCLLYLPQKKGEEGA